MLKEEKIQILKNYMGKNNLNKVQAAKDLGVSEGAVRFWLKGERKISDTIIKLIEFKKK